MNINSFQQNNLSFMKQDHYKNKYTYQPLDDEYWNKQPQDIKDRFQEGKLPGDHANFSPLFKTPKTPESARANTPIKDQSLLLISNEFFSSDSKRQPRNPNNSNAIQPQPKVHNRGGNLQVVDEVQSEYEIYDNFQWFEHTSIKKHCALLRECAKNGRMENKIHQKEIEFLQRSHDSDSEDYSTDKNKKGFPENGEVKSIQGFLIYLQDHQFPTTSNHEEKNEVTLMEAYWQGGSLKKQIFKHSPQCEIFTCGIRMLKRNATDGHNFVTKPMFIRQMKKTKCDCTTNPKMIKTIKKQNQQKDKKIQEASKDQKNQKTVSINKLTGKVQEKKTAIELNSEKSKNYSKNQKNKKKSNPKAKKLQFNNRKAINGHDPFNQDQDEPAEEGDNLWLNEDHKDESVGSRIKSKSAQGQKNRRNSRNKSMKAQAEKSPKRKESKPSKKGILSGQHQKENEKMLDSSSNKGSLDNFVIKTQKKSLAQASDQQMDDEKSLFQYDQKILNEQRRKPRSQHKAKECQRDTSKRQVGYKQLLQMIQKSGDEAKKFRLKIRLLSDSDRLLKIEQEKDKIKSEVGQAIAEGNRKKLAKLRSYVVKNESNGELYMSEDGFKEMMDKKIQKEYGFEPDSDELDYLWQMRQKIQDVIKQGLKSQRFTISRQREILKLKRDAEQQQGNENEEEQESEDEIDQMIDEDNKKLQESYQQEIVKKSEEYQKEKNYKNSHEKTNESFLKNFTKMFLKENSHQNNQKEEKKEETYPAKSWPKNWQKAQENYPYSQCSQYYSECSQSPINNLQKQTSPFIDDMNELSQKVTPTDQGKTEQSDKTKMSKNVTEVQSRYYEKYDPRVDQQKLLDQYSRQPKLDQQKENKENKGKKQKKQKKKKIEKKKKEEEEKEEEEEEENEENEQNEEKEECEEKKEKKENRQQPSQGSKEIKGLRKQCRYLKAINIQLEKKVLKLEGEKRSAEQLLLKAQHIISQLEKDLNFERQKESNNVNRPLILQEIEQIVEKNQQLKQHRQSVKDYFECPEKFVIGQACKRAYQSNKREAELGNVFYNLNSKNQDLENMLGAMKEKQQQKQQNIGISQQLNNKTEDKKCPQNKQTQTPNEKDKSEELSRLLFSKQSQNKSDDKKLSTIKAKATQPQKQKQNRPKSEKYFKIPNMDDRDPDDEDQKQEKKIAKKNSDPGKKSSDYSGKPGPKFNHQIKGGDYVKRHLKEDMKQHFEARKNDDWEKKKEDSQRFNSYPMFFPHMQDDTSEIDPDNDHAQQILDMIPAVDRLEWILSANLTSDDRERELADNVFEFRLRVFANYFSAVMKYYPSEIKRRVQLFLQKDEELIIYFFVLKGKEVSRQHKDIFSMLCMGIFEYANLFYIQDEKSENSQLFLSQYPEWAQMLDAARFRKDFQKHHLFWEGQELERKFFNNQYEHMQAQMERYCQLGKQLRIQKKRHEIASEDLKNRQKKIWNMVAQVQDQKIQLQDKNKELSKDLENYLQGKQSQIKADTKILSNSHSNIVNSKNIDHSKNSPVQKVHPTQNHLLNEASQVQTQHEDPTQSNSSKINPTQSNLDDI